jgi:hypothetical protein
MSPKGFCDKYDTSLPNLAKTKKHSFVMLVNRRVDLQQHETLTLRHSRINIRARRHEIISMHPLGATAVDVLAKLPQKAFTLPFISWTSC